MADYDVLWPTITDDDDDEGICHTMLMMIMTNYNVLWRNMTNYVGLVRIRTDDDDDIDDHDDIMRNYDRWRW